MKYLYLTIVFIYLHVCIPISIKNFKSSEGIKGRERSESSISSKITKHNISFNNIKSSESIESLESLKSSESFKNTAAKKSNNPNHPLLQISKNDSKESTLKHFIYQDQNKKTSTIP